jgi:hypothetical protein
MQVHWQRLAASTLSSLRGQGVFSGGTGLKVELYAIRGSGRRAADVSATISSKWGV